MARAPKEVSIIDQTCDLVAELAETNEGFIEALHAVLSGEATNFDVLDVLSAGLPDQEEEAAEEPEVVEEAPRRGRRAAVVEEEPEVEAPRRGRGRAAAVVEEEEEPEVEAPRRGRRAAVVEEEPAAAPARRGRR